MKILKDQIFKNCFYVDLFIDKKYRYNPDEITIKRIIASNDHSFNYFRKSSTSYCNKKFVKEFILNRHSNKCVLCSNGNNLQIDHIISVKKCFEDKNFVYCNSLQNLQTLCSSCNIKKHYL